MTIQVIDARQHATAVKAAITDQLGPWAAYDYDEVPGTNGNIGDLPSIFVQVAISRRYAPAVRMTAQAGITGWRISARAVGRTIDEARWAHMKVSAALNEALLSIGGQMSTPVQFESEEPPAYDDGRYSGLHAYTYAL